MKKRHGKQFLGMWWGLWLYGQASQIDVDAAQLAAFGKTTVRKDKDITTSPQESGSLPTLEQWEKAYEKEKQTQRKGYDE